MNKELVRPSEFDEKLGRLARLYYRILIVVGISGSGKTDLLREVSGELNFPFVNLNLELSRRLLNLTRSQRSMQVTELVSDILDDHPDHTLAVDNTELIFEPSLKLNQRGLLQTVSRRRSLIWSISGRLAGDQIVYAYPGHSEYKRIPAGDFQVVEV